jgi:hypothetical protein
VGDSRLGQSQAKGDDVRKFLDKGDRLTWFLSAFAVVLAVVMVTTVWGASRGVEVASAIQAGATAALVIATVGYMLFTLLVVDATNKQTGETAKLAEEAKRQRLDSCRPLLVPLGGADGIARLDDVPKLDGDRLLHVHNVGLGPATNVAVRLEFGPPPAPHLELDEAHSRVGPLQAGADEVVRQSRPEGADKRLLILDGSRLVVGYDDLFGRRFETEARWVGLHVRWTGIKTTEVKPPAPDSEAKTSR